MQFNCRYYLSIIRFKPHNVYQVTRTIRDHYDVGQSEEIIHYTMGFRLQKRHRDRT